MDGMSGQNDLHEPCSPVIYLVTYFILLFLLFIFNVQGTNRGPTDRIQHIKKH